MAYMLHFTEHLSILTLTQEVYMLKRILPIIMIVLGFSAVIRLNADELPASFDREYQIKGEVLSANITMDVGEFTLTRSADVKIARVHIAYDPDKCDVRVSYNPEDSNFYLDVDHHRLFEKDNHKVAKIFLELPAEPITDLRVKQKAGEMDFTLGDLSLRSCRIKGSAGELTVDFDAPNRIRMVDLDISCTVGESTLRNIGNARFRKARINGGIGEMTVDFSGWADTSGEVDIDNDLGETTVYIPRDVMARMRVSKAGFLTDYSCSDWFEEHHGYYYSKNSIPGKENLYLHISSGIGELSINSN